MRGEGHLRARADHPDQGLTPIVETSDRHSESDGGWLWTGWQTESIRSLAFSIDGHLLASGGDDPLVQPWDPQSGTKVQRLSGQGGAVHSLAWNPDGSIWVWQPEMPEPDTHVRWLSGHTSG
jgi:WD40 repeat protein